MAAIVSPSSLPSLLAPGFAFGQDSPWARLVELAERKGLKDFSIGRLVCAALGLPDDHRDCSVYQIGDQDRDGYNHAFNVRVAPDKAVDVIVFRNNPNGGEFYLTGLDGRLKRATALTRPNGISRWSPVSTDSPAARAGFAAELAFWRAKQSELEREPDRKD
jgi:hypothetical protein